MSWRLLSTETTVAPRALTRATSKPRWSPYGYMRRPELPSVNGVAEVTHCTWRHDCGALAVTSPTEPNAPQRPGQCGKCGHS